MWQENCGTRIKTLHLTPSLSVRPWQSPYLVYRCQLVEKITWKIVNVLICKYMHTSKSTAHLIAGFPCSCQYISFFDITKWIKFTLCLHCVDFNVKRVSVHKQLHCFLCHNVSWIVHINYVVFFIAHFPHSLFCLTPNRCPPKSYCLACLYLL